MTTYNANTLIDAIKKAESKHAKAELAGDNNHPMGVGSRGILELGGRDVWVSVDASGAVFIFKGKPRICSDDQEWLANHEGECSRVMAYVCDVPAPADFRTCRFPVQ